MTVGDIRDSCVAVGEQPDREFVGQQVTLPLQRSRYRNDSLRTSPRNVMWVKLEVSPLGASTGHPHPRALQDRLSGARIA